jgi:uncharacterized membrane protein YdbT with pleckstrin-like domain
VRERIAGGAAGEERLLAVSPVLFGRNPLKHLLTAILCVVLVGIVIYVVEWLTCRNTRLVVTTRRTILQTGIIRRETNEVRHQDIRNIQVTQSATERLLGVGTIELSSAGQSDVEIEAKKMPNPHKIAELIREHR